MGGPSRKPRGQGRGRSEERDECLEVGGSATAVQRRPASGSWRERHADVRWAEGELRTGARTAHHVPPAVRIQSELPVLVGASLGLGQPPVTADEAMKRLVRRLRRTVA